MKIDRVIVGSYLTNCYILSKDNKCLIIDPGDDYLKIKKAIGKKDVVGIIITHHHFDHTGALVYFNNINVYDYTNLKEGMNNINNFCFEVIYTKGHTDDSICIYFKDYNVMFVGDFIFKNGIGRTDLGGNIEDMQQSLIKISAYAYNKNIMIYPGHGDLSLLSDELKKLL